MKTGYDMISNVFKKYPHPLEDTRDQLFNPVTGQISSVEVNVANSLEIGQKNGIRISEQAN